MRKTPLQKLLLHIANLVVIGFILLPMAAVVIGSLLAEKNLAGDTRSIIPGDITFDNFRVIISRGEQRGQVFEQATYLPDNVKKIYHALGNSVVISVSVTFLTLVFASLSAYTVVKLRLRWVAWLLSVNVFARFVPIIVLMIPLYVVFRKLGMLNSIWGVVIALTGFLLPYGILILVPYFASIPKELDEAAIMDGASYMQVLTRIFIPVALPGIIAATIFAFTVSWAQFLYPLAFTTSTDQLMLPVGIVTTLIKGDVFNWGQIMTGALLGALPPLVIYAFLMDYYIAGLTAGATKG